MGPNKKIAYFEFLKFTDPNHKITSIPLDQLHNNSLFHFMQPPSKRQKRSGPVTLPDQLDRINNVIREPAFALFSPYISDFCQAFSLVSIPNLPVYYFILAHKAQHIGSLPASRPWVEVLSALIQRLNNYREHVARNHEDAIESQRVPLLRLSVYVYQQLFYTFLILSYGMLRSLRSIRDFDTSEAQLDCVQEALKAFVVSRILAYL